VQLHVIAEACLCYPPDNLRPERTVTDQMKAKVDCPVPEQPAGTHQITVTLHFFE